MVSAFDPTFRMYGVIPPGLPDTKPLGAGSPSPPAAWQDANVFSVLGDQARRSVVNQGLVAWGFLIVLVWAWQENG